MGELLDINPATLRNWVEKRREVVAVRRWGGEDVLDPAEFHRLQKENAELRRANEILKTASGFSPRGVRPSTQVKLCCIHACWGRFGVEPICAVLSEHSMTIAPGTYYKWLACPVRSVELEERIW